MDSTSPPMDSTSPPMDSTSPPMDSNVSPSMEALSRFGEYFARDVEGLLLIASTDEHDEIFSMPSNDAALRDIDLDAFLSTLAQSEHSRDLPADVDVTSISLQSMYTTWYQQPSVDIPPTPSHSDAASSPRSSPSCPPTPIADTPNDFAAPPAYDVALSCNIPNLSLAAGQPTPYASTHPAKLVIPEVGLPELSDVMLDWNAWFDPLDPLVWLSAPPPPYCSSDDTSVTSLVVLPHAPETSALFAT